MFLIDGKRIAENILLDLKQKVVALPFKPLFCDVLIGNDPASVQYVNMKYKSAEKVGIGVQRAEFPIGITQSELVGEISRLNKLPHMCGLIVQLPLPAGIESEPILNAIDPQIDVDCTGLVNSEKFYSGSAEMEFPTAAAVMAILDSLKADFSKSKFLVLGQGRLVGQPVIELLKRRGFDASSVGKSSSNIPALIKSADVVVCATGQGQWITGEMLKEGSVVIDAGTAESEGGVVGDVDAESASKSAKCLSPVPGGVGPVTVAMLLKNVVDVAQRKVL